MTVKNMEKNLMNTQKANQTVRIQSKNHLTLGHVESIDNDVLDLKAQDGDHKFNMNDVDNYKIIK